ncbi:MAG: glycosyltransferase family 39 protein [Muribaculaceae bacterium]|nr:glycosyltransferase family 39 protein [Roseburia sp.]MCM1432028.1 glycosyltransferase family 39 protein [Muribaculaceae bacterium]MCM1493719.1 glycosyltransferase family 39 protein [Muribaculaceae bacterium]
MGKNTRVFWGVYLCLLCLGGILFTHMGTTDAVPDLVSAFIVAVGTMAAFTWILKNEPDGAAAAVMLLGYAVRLAYRYGADSGKFTLAFTSAPSDAVHFWTASSNLYWGIPDEIILTKYPYLLRWFYEMFGNNRFAAEYVNILCWVLGTVILLRLGRRAGLSGSKKYILYGIWVILPSSILIGTDLLRENIMLFFDMWSFYIFLGWMKSGRKSQLAGAFLLVAPAAYLHTASIVLWAVYVAIAAFWNVKSQKYRFQWKTIQLIFAGVLGGWLILFSPLRSVFGDYLGDLSLYGITHRAYEVGGSDYLQWMDCQNLLQFVPYTLLRMAWFLFSPVPFEARGAVDILSFATDGLPVFCLLAYMVYQLRDKDKRGSICAALVCVLAFSGIFAWGVRNAGTAIRHRMLVWGILIMGSCIALGKPETIGKRQN